MTTVLITAAGGGVAISIMKASRLAGYKIIATDIDPLAGGLHRAEKGYIVQRANSTGYISEIIEICNKENVDALIPGCDYEVVPISNNRERIENETDTKVIVGTRKAVAIGRNKYETQQFLMRHGFNFCVSSFKDCALSLANEVGYPLIVKPESGAGSVNLFKVENERELLFYIELVESRGDVPIIQEHLSPADQEYTTGVMFSKDKKLLGSITLKREIKKGSSYTTWSGDFPEIRHEMEKIGEKLNTFGPLNIQCRLTDRGPVVFEINPRFSGTTANRAYLGFNDVKMIVENFLFGTFPEDVSYRKGMVMVRYLNEIYMTDRDVATIGRGKMGDYF